MKKKRNLNTKWLLLQNDQNADTTLLHSHDELYVSHVCKRIFKIQALIKQLLTKYQIFKILPQISHFHKYRNFSSIFATF